MKRTRLCRLDELSDPGALRAELPDDPEGRGVCVVRRGDTVRVYENRCPHTGAPMDWVEGRFLDLSETLIQCSLHGAQFRIEDGFCIWGPCAGQGLRRLPSAVAQGSVWLEQPVDE